MGSYMDMPISEVMSGSNGPTQSNTYTVDGREFELKHYGVKGMKWGKRKPRYIPVGTAGHPRSASVTSSSGSTQSEAARKAARKQKAKRALKIGAAVAGTALAAYGTYRLAKYMQGKRQSAAMQKAQDYINNNIYNKVRDSRFADGTREMGFANKSGTIKFTTGGSRREVGKAVGEHNAKVIAEGRQMYKNATNTRLDRGLAKVVNTGDAIGSKAKSAATKAKNATTKAATKAKNSVLDIVNPQYEYVPGKTTTSISRDSNGVDWTETVTDYVKKKKRR